VRLALRFIATPQGVLSVHDKSAWTLRSLPEGETEFIALAKKYRRLQAQQLATTEM
jgi:hypothetical protein